MDNLTHTLIGASLAASGLRRRTRYAAAAMMIGANIPDVDVIAVPLGHSVEWRRGITHGIPALILWPFILTGVFLLWHRWRGGATDARPGEPPLRPRQLLLLSTLAVWTHPTYDWFNSYGMRWLMPLDGTWFYGDSLFIIDPYLMAMLAVGVYVVRRRRRAGVAQPFAAGKVAVALGAAYTVALLALHDVAERQALRELGARPGGAPARMMAAPTAANPLRWEIVADRGTHYERGELRIGDVGAMTMDDSIAVGLDDPRSQQARRDPRAAGFLDWARWPVYRIDEATETVHIVDIRYASPEARGSWASVALPAGGE